MHPQYKYGPAKVKEFYAENNVIFLTGATGFVGKTLLEKILRSLPSVKKIYLLIRVSGKRTLQDRIEKEIFTSRIFDTLKSQFATPEEFYNTVVKKVIPIKGDITLERLGLSDEDLAMIQADTNVVLNSAASVSFDDPLNNALELNTKGPLRTFEIARGMPRLAAVVHISTCYVNSHMIGATIQEKVYPHPLNSDPEALFSMLQQMSYEDIRNYEREVVLKTFLNTYTFSKSLTEHLIQKRYMDMGLPIAIVRPSIVTAAVSEPVSGWVEGTAAANKAVVSCALGHVQEWIGEAPKKSDLIPVDMVVKLILLSATTADRTVPCAPIYHAATTSINPITWGTFASYLVAYWRSIPVRPRRRVSDDIRFEMFDQREFKFRFDQRFGPHIRALATMTDDQQHQKRRLQARISRAHAVPTMFRNFSTNEWIFEAIEAMHIDDQAPPEFQSHLRGGMDWHAYMEDYNAGVHQFILREKVDRTSFVVDYGLKPPTLELEPYPRSGHKGEKESEIVSRL